MSATHQSANHTVRAALQAELNYPLVWCVGLRG